MRICFVYKEDYPWDVRVEKIVRLLADAGHDVTLLARNDARRPARERSDGFRIRRLPPLPRWLGPLNGLFGVPAYFSPVWFLALWRVVREASAELIVVRDLPLMPLAVIVGRICGCRVVFDMAECYPLMYASRLPKGLRRIREATIRNPRLAKLMESFSVRHADHVLVMIEESRDRLLEMGIPPDKISIVSNTPPRSETPPREHSERPLLRMIYVGFLGPNRGLHNALLSLAADAESRAAPPVFELDVVGTGAAQKELEALARSLGLEGRARFHGWQDHDVVADLYAASDIGILTYQVCSHWNHTIPNKLFDYMRAGMPVLATDVGPIRRIIEDVGCGVIFRDGDPVDGARALAELIDPDRRAEMGRRGFEAVRDRYNWERDGGRLLEIVARLAPARGTS